MSFFRAIWKGNMKHKKLYDERAMSEGFACEPIVVPDLDEVLFRAKYLGSTLVEKASSEEATAEAIKTILSMAKMGGKKLQRVTVSLSLNGIKVVDIPTEETHLDVSIYSISYCSADAAHSQVFAFIATNANETMECHAFLCPKRKTAQIMSLTLAKVFRAAYDLLVDEFHEDKFLLSHEMVGKNLESKIIRSNNVNNTEDDDDNNNHFDQVDTALLIDFHSDLGQHRLGGWECFDEETSDNLNYSSFWDGSKDTSSFTTNHFNNFFSNGPWENSRTNLLCS